MTISVRDKMCRLDTILEGLEYTIVRGENKACLALEVHGLECDSRKVNQDQLFFALRGTANDGHQYLSDVCRRGCGAMVVEAHRSYDLPADWKGCLIEVEDSRFAYGRAAANFYGTPGQDMTLIGITGTNGKTTISYLLEDALKESGIQVGVIGTVNYRYHGEHGLSVMPSPFTTPEPVRLQALLAEMKEAGVSCVIMEVSSHALAQARLGNIRFDICAFTNLSQDHLDYHLGMTDYFQAKTLLFTDHLKKGGSAVISTPLGPADNSDWSGKLQELCTAQKNRVLLCGPQDEADIQVLDYQSSLTETTIQLRFQDNNQQLTTPLVGQFNVDNLLTTLTVLKAMDIDLHQAVQTLSQAIGAPGRLQRVAVTDGTIHQQPVVFVDYAHTPDALRQVLTTVAALPHRELYCLFGCGGDRDVGKRPIMGSFAGGLADVVIVTDDNPRTEKPEEIRKQIVPGVEKAGLARQQQQWLVHRQTGESGYVEIGNRREAIRAAIDAAGGGDIVLIAGKGHEQYQQTNSDKRFFDDYLEAGSAMLRWHLDSLAAATTGEIHQADAALPYFDTLSTDSRTISGGDMFLALKGENYDGHDFLTSVAEKQCGCLLVAKNHTAGYPLGVPRIEVEDTLKALGALAHYRRQLIAAHTKQKVIAITGSCGKTTVKEMTAAILEQKWPAGPDNADNCVLKTKGNLNNLIGLPLSLLPLDLHHQAAVLEMGMNAKGEIRTMARQANPDICCITNVHAVHLEGLQTVAGVAAAKEELFAEAGDNSILVINLDNVHVREMADRYGQQKITFSESREGLSGVATHLWAESVKQSAGTICFTLRLAEEKEQVELHTPGLHNVTNSLAAAAIGVAAGVSLKEIALGLGLFRPADKRMVTTRSTRGLSILNDTYNANPASMEAGLKTLKDMGTGRTAAMLGDMLELGPPARQAHYQLGQQVGELGIDYLGVVGEFRETVAKGAIEAGMAADNVIVFADKEQAAAWLIGLENEGMLRDEDWLLVKASRGLRMETIVACLTGKP